MNINAPTEFAQSVGNTIANLYYLFEQTCEVELLPVDQRQGKDWKCLFEASGQFKRPNDFLQCLLDMLRIMFEPEPPGTFYLNANPDFIYEEIDGAPFRLGYLTAISEPHEPIAQFYKRKLAPLIEEYGYFSNSIFATYVFVTKGAFSRDHIGKVVRFFDAGFSVDDVLQSFANIIKDDGGVSKRNRSYAGFSTDEALGDRMRISMWLFMYKADDETVETEHSRRH
jgi:hypothetical protein